MSKAFGRSGLGVNAGFDGIRCTLAAVDASLTLSIGPFSKELDIGALIRSGAEVFAVGHDGFVLIELSPAQSSGQDTILPFSRSFTVPGMIAKPADAYWLDVKDTDGHFAQSVPVFPPSSGETLPTFYFDEKEKGIMPGVISREEALLGSWRFDERDGALILDTSAYGNFGKFGGVSTTSFGAGVGGPEQSPARGILYGEPALVFDGTKKQFATLPFGIIPQGCFTIAFTMQSKPQNVAQTILLLGWQLSLKYAPDGKLAVTAGSNTIKSSEPLPMPCSIKVVYDMRWLELYVNNKLSARCDIPDRLPRLSGGIILGCGYGSPGPSLEPYTGSIAGLKIMAAPVRP